MSTPRTDAAKEWMIPVAAIHESNSIEAVPAELSAELESALATQSSEIKRLREALEARAKFVLQKSFDTDLQLAKKLAEKCYERGEQFEANAVWSIHSEMTELQKLIRAALSRG